ncbi:hypothetical protein LPTSP3_g07380 [Leptospira kobayashii]|uniref:HTH araC/xylS-type domain-containing protein n=1 Tax=Leptospira kobayashii TaxID=1917830 RepID=A0ABM7UGP5_9LEPT|nr:7TM-DISM domain-containing protein [Leptospira kobayashii]BDA77808.1 hypothetical protein LPTSP3_g07380 [Leptospira kobayashii]
MHVFSVKFQFAFLFAFFFLFNCSTERPARAQDGRIILEDLGSILNVSREVEYKVAPTEANLSEIRNDTAGWERNGKPVFDQGFSTNVYWLRLHITNPTHLSNWYITLRNNRLDFVDFFLVTNGNIQSLATGDYRPLPPNSNTSYPAFEFVLSPQETGTLYIRIQADVHLAFFVRLYAPEEFGAEKNLTAMIHLIFIGLFLIFLIFQVRFNPTLSGFMEIYLSLAVLFIFLWAFCFSGEASRLLWPDSVWCKNKMQFVFALLFEIFFALFLTNYLQLRDFSPRLNFAFRIFISVVGLLSISFFFPLRNHTVVQVANAVMIVRNLLMTAGVIQCLRYKRFWVLYILASWLVIAVSNFINFFMVMKLLPYNTFTLYSHLFAFPIDILVITISQIVRYRNLRKERDDLREKVNELMKLPASSAREKRVRSLNVTRILENLAEYFEREKPYLEENLSLTTVAHTLGIRSDQLSAILNKEMNTSFSLLVNEYRVREACKLMKESSDMNLLEIAFECGFGSRTNFNRVFKQLTDLAPVDYRKEQIAIREDIS